MLIVLYHWYDSVKMLLSLSFFKDITCVFFETCKKVLKFFYAFFGIYVITTFFSVYRYGSASLNFDVENAKLFGSLRVVTLLLIMVTGFIIRVSFIIFSRVAKKDNITKNYISLFFLKFIQMSVALSLLSMLFLLLVLSFKVTIFPSVHWVFLHILYILEMFAMFYWLDKGVSFKNIFTSIEGAVNLLFYNVPVIAFCFIAKYLWMLCISYGKCFIFIQENKVFLLSSPMALFLVELIFISFLFVLYQRRKSIVYSQSFF
jgi:hypothetical protein